MLHGQTPAVFASQATIDENKLSITPSQAETQVLGPHIFGGSYLHGGRACRLSTRTPRSPALALPALKRAVCSPVDPSEGCTNFNQQAQQLIDDTFDEAQPATPGFITFDEYSAMVSRKPQLLEFMTIQSLNSMIS